ncbi:MAG TPA: hypothetical protein VNA13_02175 [Xanthomonadales bacterium]|nr:hypothetical protein [Xanthomonadales bacterium]
MIKANLKNHFRYYIAFTLVQILGLGLVLLASGNKQIQLYAVFGTTCFYFLFAIVHHLLDHDLTTKIVIEYALIGCLGLAVSMVVFNT